MWQCWNPNPNQRPPFADLVYRIGGLINLSLVSGSKAIFLSLQEFPCQFSFVIVKSRNKTRNIDLVNGLFTFSCSLLRLVAQLLFV